jgi:hypothetical protein
MLTRSRKDKNSRPRWVTDGALTRITRCGSVPLLAGVLVLGCVSRTSAQDENYRGLVEVDQEIWQQYFPDQRIMFGLTTDGTWTAYVSSNRVKDPGGYPIEELTLRAIAVAIGGDQSKDCWWTGGQKHCDPPPPQ